MNRHLLPWLLAYLAAILLSVFLTPPFQTPDEPAHVTIAMVYAGSQLNQREVIEARILDRLTDFRFWEYVQLPTPDPSPKRLYDAPLLRTKPTQLSKAQLYYKSVGHIFALMNITDPVTAMYLMRIIGACLAFIAALLACIAVTACFNQYHIQVTALSFMAIPQFIFISGSANPGNVAWVTAGMMILGTVLLFRRTDRILPAGLILGGIFLAAVTHRAALTVAPGALAAIGLTWSQDTGKPAQQNRGLIYLAISTLILLITAALSYMQPGLIRTLITHMFQTARRLGINIAPDALNIDWLMLFLYQYHRSFWLGFGWLKIFDTEWIYGILSLHYLLPFLGILLLFTHQKNRESNPISRKMIFALSIIALGAFWGGAVRFGLQKELSQGRYLFPALPAFAILATTGWFNLVPEKLHRYLSYFLVTAAWSFLVYSLFYTLVTGFYFI